MVVICLIVLVLTGAMRLDGQSPKVDFTGVPEYKSIWRIDFGNPSDSDEPNIGSLLQRVPDLCGTGRHAITMSVSGRGTFTFGAARPVDTTALWVWPNSLPPSVIKPFDYDGAEPTEYVTSDGTVLTCSKNLSPFPLLPIDTLVCGDRRFAVGQAMMLDDDPFIDLVSIVGSDYPLYGPSALSIVRGGPHAGRGCERVDTLTLVDSRRRNGAVFIWRSVNGEVLLLQFEHEFDHATYRPENLRDTTYPVWMMLYKMNIAGNSGEYDVTFERLDSLPGQASFDGHSGGSNLGFLYYVRDSVLNRDIVVLRNGGYVTTTAFEISGNRFHQVSNTNADFRYWQAVDLGRSLSTQRPVVSFFVAGGATLDRSPRIILAYADEPGIPIATVLNLRSLVSSNERFVVIEDQTGDGINDILLVYNGDGGRLMMDILSLDTNRIQIEVTPPNSDVSIGFQHNLLDVLVYKALMLDLEIMDIRGRILPLRQNVATSSGLTRIDLTDDLRVVAPGFYVLRVRGADFVKNISILVD